MLRSSMEEIMSKFYQFCGVRKLGITWYDVLEDENARNAWFCLAFWLLLNVGIDDGRVMLWFRSHFDLMFMEAKTGGKKNA